MKPFALPTRCGLSLWASARISPAKAQRVSQAKHHSQVKCLVGMIELQLGLACRGAAGAAVVLLRCPVAREPLRTSSVLQFCQPLPDIKHVDRSFAVRYWASSKRRWSQLAHTRRKTLATIPSLLSKLRADLRNPAMNFTL